MNKDKEPRNKQVPFGVKILIGTIASFGALGIGDHLDKQVTPIYQPSDLSPTSNGTDVPEGMQAPVGVVISEVPGNPSLRRIDYATAPDGQTLASKIISVPSNSEQ